MSSELTVLEGMISEAFKMAIGDPLLVGSIILFFFILVIAVTKLDIGVSLMILIPLFVVLAMAGFLDWFIMLAGGLAIGGVIYLAGRRFLLAQR